MARRCASWWSPATCRWPSCALGASVAHSGVCLTVVETRPGALRVQASPETLARTTLGELAAGHPDQPRALAAARRRAGRPSGVRPCRRAWARSLAMRSRTADWHGSRSRCPQALAPLLAVKGSIAVDGISLTVNEAAPTASPSPSSPTPGPTRPLRTAASATGSTSRPTCWRATSRASWRSAERAIGRPVSRAPAAVGTQGRGLPLAHRGDHRGRPQRPDVHPGRRRGPRERGRPRHPGADRRRPSRSTSWPSTAAA